jgi:hypothetical protein
MQIIVSTIKENEDGSANVSIDLDNEAREYLINYAFINLLEKAVAEGKKYKVEDSDVHTSL